MKKLSIALVALLSSLAINSQASAADRCCVSVPCNPCGGFILEVDPLYLRTNLFDNFTPGLVGAANLFDTVGSPLNQDFDCSNSCSDDSIKRWNWGYKVAVGYAFPCSGNDIMLSYTHFSNSHHRDFADTASVPVPDLLLVLANPGEADVFPAFGQSVFIDPSEGITTDGQAVTIPVTWSFPLPGSTRVYNSVNENVVDLDLGQHVCVGGSTRLRWFAGARWASLERKFDATFSGSVPTDTLETGTASAPLIGFDFDANNNVGNAFFIPSVDYIASEEVTADLVASIRERSRFNGVGPRVGVDANYAFPCSGFGIAASASAALLIGETRHTVNTEVEGSATVDFINDATTATNGAIVDEFNNTVAFLEVNNYFGSTATPSVSQSENLDRRNDTHVVPNLDAKIALSYNYCNCNTKWLFEAGYMVSYYWNATDSLDFASSDMSSGNNRDLSFDGPYLGLKVLL